MQRCNRCGAPLLLQSFFRVFWMLLNLSLPSVSPASRPVSSVTERVTNPRWHRVPCQCHHPRSVPAIHPRAASPGDSRGAAAGCSHPSLCLELTRFYLVATSLVLWPFRVKKLFPGAEEVVVFRVGAGGGGQVLSFSALKRLQGFALCVENSAWDLCCIGGC